MENEVKEEVKVETKKKGNGLFTLFVTSNVESNVTSNVESNTTSNVESNVTSNVDSNVASNTTTSNTQVATKLTDAEALSVGKDLYKKATKNIINPFNVSNCTKISGDDSSTLYDCTTAYNTLKTIFVANHEAFKVFNVKDGKYLYTAGGTGAVGTFTTTLTVASVDTDKLVFTAKTTIEYGKGIKADQKTDTFEVVKENGTWKVSKYTYRPTTLK